MYNRYQGNSGRVERVPDAPQPVSRLLPATTTAVSAVYFRKERRENVKDIIVPPRMYKYNFAILLKKHYL